MKDDPQKLQIKIGSWLEASANGRFGIVALIVCVFGYLIGTTFGMW